MLFFQMVNKLMIDSFIMFYLLYNIFLFTNAAFQVSTVYAIQAKTFWEGVSKK